ncbi:hypothetical protein ANACOL_00395 [Anaerotruncus colihominis DSM 17241]|uniref:Uncharacterized protein n=1 Tax=Anaerotruncus colihominis DSM 17241 TaxID=445972 RepID=B0P6L6_9FIRM|nr:hypothetical protein ANACOL_00395 [Anaerotruncus colihominis DSM 17241]
MVMPFFNLNYIPASGRNVPHTRRQSVWAACGLRRSGGGPARFL